MGQGQSSSTDEGGRLDQFLPNHPVIERFVGVATDFDVAEEVASLPFVPPATEDGQEAVHELAGPLIRDLINHRTNNLKALVDLVATRADSLRRSTAYGRENRKEDRDVVQAKIRFVHRGLFIIRVVWQGLASEVGVVEMLDRVEGQAGALQAVLNDGRDQNTVLPEDVDFGDITDQLSVRANGAVAKAASISAGFDAVTNGDTVALPYTTASLKLVTALAKLAQYRVTSVSHRMVLEAVRLLLTMSSPGAAWPSLEGNPLFARLRANSSLSKKLAAALTHHFVSGPLDFKPAPEEEPSIVGDVWNVFKLPFQAALDLVAGEDEWEPHNSVGLHGHSLRVLLVLGMDVSFVPHQELRESEDFFKAALAEFGDSDAATAAAAAATAGTAAAAAAKDAGALRAASELEDDGKPFAVSYSSLYTSICGDVAAGELMHEEEALLLYFLVSTNMQFDRYLSSRADDLDQLMLPFLEILYRSPEFCIEQIYTQLATLVLLTEMPDFNSCMCALILPEVPWFDGPRALKDLSLGDLIMLVMLHVCLRNMSLDMDQYIHVSTMAVLANMSADFANMHAYAAQRLVSFYCHVSKLYVSVAPSLEQVEVGCPPPPGSPKYELGLIVGTALGILNSCLSNRLRHNPNLIYTILVEKQHFAPPAHVPQSANELENINILIRHFESRLERSGSGENPSVNHVLTVIKAGAQSLPDSTLKKLPQMHLTFVEKEDMHTFFLSFINELIIA